MSGARARGFTLLEVAVALAILATGVVTCLQIFGRSLRLEERASRQTRVVLYARGLMDSVMIGLTLGDPKWERDGCRTLDTTREGYAAQCCVAHAGAAEGIDQDAGESDESVRTIRCEVAWQDGIGRKSYALETLWVAPENG